MPAQTACQTEPSRVAPKAMVVPRTRITPLVPEDVDQEKAGQERAEDAADHPPGVDLADRGPGSLEALQPVDRQLGHHRADRPHATARAGRRRA